ncbi:hypothetical protein JCM8097_005288 [Rhodosporidiobolus ruineniae]
MRLLVALLALVGTLSSLSTAAASTATLIGALRLNHSTPLDLQASARLSPLSPSSPAKERTREIYGPEGQYRFRFPAVEEGDYLLRIDSRQYAFQEYFISVKPALSTEGGEARVEASLWSPQAKQPILGSDLPLPLGKSPSLPLLPLPTDPLPLVRWRAVLPSLRLLTLSPPKPAFSLVAFLKGNPMVWVLVLGGLLAFLTPKLMASMDEETLEEVRASQAKMFGGPAASLQSFDPSSSMSRYLAGSTSAPSPSSAADPSSAPPAGGKTAGASGVKAGGAGKGRKRK